LGSGFTTRIISCAETAPDSQRDTSKNRGTDRAVELGMEERRAQSFLIDDAARLLGVSRRTVYYRIREGRLVTIRCRAGSQRVLLSSIERLLREPARAKGVK
jgi:excisionase family DNA binding protein